MISSKLSLVVFVLLLSVVFLSGCSTLPKPGPDSEPAIRQKADLIPEGTQLDIEVYDPIERFNRGAYRFNYYFDKYLFLPIVRGLPVHYAGLCRGPGLQLR